VLTIVGRVSFSSGVSGYEKLAVTLLLFFLLLLLMLLLLLLFVLLLLLLKFLQQLWLDCMSTSSTSERL